MSTSSDFSCFDGGFAGIFTSSDLICFRIDDETGVRVKKKFEDLYEEATDIPLATSAAVGKSLG